MILITEAKIDKLEVTEVFGSQTWGDLYLLEYEWANHNRASYSGLALRTDFDKYLKINPEATPADVAGNVMMFSFLRPDAPDFINKEPWEISGGTTQFLVEPKKANVQDIDKYNLLRFDGYDYTFWSPHSDYPLSRVYDGEHEYGLNAEKFYLTKVEAILKDHPWVVKWNDIRAPRYHEDIYHADFWYKLPQEVHNKIWDWIVKNTSITSTYYNRHHLSGSDIWRHLVWSAWCDFNSGGLDWALGNDPFGLAPALKTETEYDPYATKYNDYGY